MRQLLLITVALAGGMLMSLAWNEVCKLGFRYLNRRDARYMRGA